MLSLPNGCMCSELAVFPLKLKWTGSKQPLIDVVKNTSKENIVKFMKQSWFFSYRFYSADKKVKQVKVRGMNSWTTWHERISSLETLLNYELQKLLAGYNTITKEVIQLSNEYEVEPETPLYVALDYAYNKVKCVHAMTIGLKSILTCSTKSAKTIGIYNMPLNQVKRRHIVKLLEQCSIDRALSPRSFNQYRSYLRMMFKELVKIEAIDFNPITNDIEREVEVEKPRKTLTPEEIIKVDLFLHEHHYNFWRHVHIFFTSGSRSTELKNLRVEDVDLVRQEFTIVTSKGRRKKRHVPKAIYDEVLPLWKELLANRNSEEFVFSKNFEPGSVTVGSDYGSRYWKRLIKGTTAKSKIHKKGKARPGIGITADYYALKHLNADNIAAKVGMKYAQSHLSHTNANTTRIYAVNEKERELEILKRVGNKFA